MPQLAGRRKATSRVPSLEIDPLSPTLGARVGGIDLAQAMDAETVAEIRQALLKYEVLFFEDQDLTPGQHRDFAARFGRLHLHPIRPSVSGTPEVLVMDDLPASIPIRVPGAQTSPLSKPRPWARCCMPATCRRRAATRCGPACARPTRDCRRSCAASS